MNKIKQRKLWAAGLLAVALLWNTVAAEVVQAAVPKTRQEMTQEEIKTSQDLSAKFIIGYYYGLMRVCEIISHDNVDDKVETLDRNMVVYNNKIYVDNTVQLRPLGPTERTSVLATVVAGEDLSKTDNVGTLNNAEALRRLAELEIIKSAEDKKGFYIIKMSGEFSNIRISEVPPLDWVEQSVNGKTKAAPEHKYRKLKGTLIGIRLTDYLRSKDALGWNLHFLSEDKKISGVVNEIKVDKADFKLNKIRSLSIYM